MAKVLQLLRSKKGIVGAILLFYGSVRGILGFLQDLTYTASNWGRAVDFLSSGLGNVLVMIAGILLILWAVFTQRPETESVADSEPDEEIKPRAQKRAEYENEQVREQVEKATSELSLPEKVAVEPRISNRDFRIHDLLKLAGTDGSYIVDKQFENCTIRGPATITLAGQLPSSSRSHLTVGPGRDCFVEGDPDSVLQEVTSGGTTAGGVIHLVGCSFRRVTFIGIGIVGNADELEWWRENAAFSRESAAPRLASQGATIELGDTAPLFLMDGTRFVPEDDSERRALFLPALIQQWAGALQPAVEDGRTFVARGTEFDDCDVYGPGVFVLAEGSVEDTFHKCDWEEEWHAFWPATKRGRYVGAIVLANCRFRRCNFKGVAFVVRLGEYKRLYRRFAGG